MKLKLEKEIISHKEQVSKLKETSVLDNAETIEKEIDNESDDFLEEKYKKEILPIIEILKPDGVSLDKYKQQVTEDLFESVKKQQVARGVLLENPEKTIEEVKDLLNSRIKYLLEDARNYNIKTKPDETLVKKAKIALLFEEDMTDAENSSYMKDSKHPRLADLRDYILGYGDEKKFTESDIDSLMKTKYKKSLTRVGNDQMYYIGSYGTLNTIPKSLMIGLVQAEEENPSYNHYWPIRNGLEKAEKGKYDNECLEQLLASNYTRPVIENLDKFQDKPLEKILKSGVSDDRDSLEYLKKLNLSKEDFDKYVDIMVKHNICYNIRETRGLSYNPEHEVIALNYTNEIENLYKVEMDVNDKNVSQNLEIIKQVVIDGNIGLALATSVCKRYVKNYAENDYEGFKKGISKYDQEHLVFEYLKDEDKIEYVNKLIGQGEEYQIVKFHKLFKEHSLGLEIFNKIKNKNLICSLKGDLSQFKELSQEEALEFIDRDRTNIFINNITSFSFPEEFLQNEKVQEACFAEFNKEIMTNNSKEARIISEKIPFPKEKLDQAILEAIKNKWIDNDRNDWARWVIYQFPDIKKYLDNPEDKERAFKDLKEQLDSGYAVYVADILECFPLDKNLLKSEEIKASCIESIEKSSHGFRDDNREFKEDIEKYFKNVERISKYVEVPNYLFQQKEKINSIYANEDKSLKLIERECIIKILNSKNPTEKYDDILKLFDETKNSNRINLNKDLLFGYITEFENGETEENKQKFISYFEEITKNFNSNIVVENWEYLYNNFSNLSETEMDNHKKLLERININWGPGFLDNGFLKNMKFSKIFDQLISYSPAQQNEMIEIVKMGMGSFVITGMVDKNEYTKNTLLYINETEGLRKFPRSEETAKQILEMFGGEYRDVALKMVSKEWLSFLNTDSKFLPPNIYFISKLVDDAGGAGNLKHLESLGNLIYQVNSALENPKTAERTKEEIKNLLSKQEVKFDKEKLSQDDRSEFYNLSNDILKASPSLYSAFSPIFESMSPKDMKIFIKEIFPFYQAQLVIIQEMGDNDEVKYKPRELVDVRHSLKDIAEKIKKSEGNTKNIFDSEKTRLVEILKGGFKNRFGLMKVPVEFSKENLRSIQNGIRYIGNISGRNTEREAIIAFYLGLEINNEWDAFRQGKEIKIEDYFSGKQLNIIKPLIKEKNKSYELLLKTTGLSKEQMPKFQEILQEDTISNIIGNTQTVDVKLGDIKRNVIELTDPDIYENQTDKNIINLLTEEGKLVGSVLAKTYSETSGKTISMTMEEKTLQSKIASVFNVGVWDIDKVKQIQDAIQPLSLVSNMVNKMREEKVDENIQELQKRLMPTGRIIEIFNRLGEEFKQESGAMALSKDLTYLESLIIKDDKKITPEEKEEIGVYLDSIKSKMKDLESTLDKVREYFNKLKKSSHLENNPLLKNRLADIEKIIYSTDSSSMIISHMTKDLNLIIENMRQCLGCMRKEINNDTNLAFGDYNKFFMMNQGEKEKSSISDEIVFFVPVKAPNGKEEMSFVLDRVYGSKSSDVLVGNILSVHKKYQALKKVNPNAKISISVSNEAMSSVGLNSEILKKRLSEVLKDISQMEEFAELSVDVPKSAFSDNYVEFGNGGVRQSGERSFSGLVIR